MFPTNHPGVYTNTKMTEPIHVRVMWRACSLNQAYYDEWSIYWQYCATDAVPILILGTSRQAVFNESLSPVIYNSFLGGFRLVLIWRMEHLDGLKDICHLESLKACGDFVLGSQCDLLLLLLFFRGVHVSNHLQRVWYCFVWSWSCKSLIYNKIGGSQTTRSPWLSRFSNF